jgi:hypothetical protein
MLLCIVAAIIVAAAAIIALDPLPAALVFAIFAAVTVLRIAAPP